MVSNDLPAVPLVNKTPWMDAMESQLDALRLVRLFLTQAPSEVRDLKSWRVDERLLETASPFAWSDDIVQAVIKAGESIPLDTVLNRWNLETESVWWRFEKPLPFRTVTDASIGLRALCFGWVKTEIPDFGLPVCAWTDGYLAGRAPWASVCPSQTFEWEHGITLGEMLKRTRQNHIDRYGLNGPDRWAEQVGLEEFMKATESIARFVLAGLAWLGQKVLVTEWAHVERHRRKEYLKRVGRQVTLRVVQLRRSEYAKKELAGTDEDTVQWQCQWVVSGHWRNQACGPHHSDRKLVWIPPYVKGPEDKPMKTTVQKVYQVSR